MWLCTVHSISYLSFHILILTFRNVQHCVTEQKDTHFSPLTHHFISLFLQRQTPALAPLGNIMIDVNNVCPLSELSNVQTIGSLSLTKSARLKCSKWEHISFSRKNLPLQATYLHMQGAIKPALLSHLCSGQSDHKERDLFGLIIFAWWIWCGYHFYQSLFWAIKPHYILILFLRTIMCPLIPLGSLANTFIVLIERSSYLYSLFLYDKCSSSSYTFPLYWKIIFRYR